MNNKWFSILCGILLLCGVFVMPVSAYAEAEAGDIVILYTNDVHTHINDEEAMSYDNIAALKKECQDITDNVLLVDAGDHIQGTAYGALDEGKTVINLMNAAGYDLATLGNHEFDYGINRMQDAVSEADFPYVSCNFKSIGNKKNVFDSYKIFDFGDTKVAIVGVTTPETIANTAPVYFQDEQGNFIYEIDGGEDGSELYNSVQKAIDEASEEGADYVIALGHLGVDGSSSPWTSRDVIANTTGLLAFIDGHSHTTIESETVKDKSGNAVVLTQTGSYMENIGQLCIKPDGSVTTQLVNGYSKTDASVTDILDSWIAEVDRQLGEKIAESDIAFGIEDEDGNRLVRIMGTNIAEFTADSYYYALNEMDGIGCDVAIINGGGVRDNAAAGDWTYHTVKAVNPFGNVLCVMEITGRQLLDALEWGARFTTGTIDSNEGGGLLHTAGLTYKVDPTVTSSVKEKDEMWAGSPDGEYRVYDVKVYDRKSMKYEPLDIEKTYSIAGPNFTLRNFGDGFNMFDGAVLIKDYIIEDYMAMAAYAGNFADTDGNGYGNISSENSPLASYEGYKLDYEDLYGSDRMIITEQTDGAFNFSNIWIWAVIVIVLIIGVNVMFFVVKKRKSN